MLSTSTGVSLLSSLFSLYLPHLLPAPCVRVVSIGTPFFSSNQIMCFSNPRSPPAIVFEPKSHLIDARRLHLCGSSNMRQRLDCHAIVKHFILPLLLLLLGSHVPPHGDAQPPATSTHSAKQLPSFPSTSRMSVSHRHRQPTPFSLGGSGVAQYSSSSCLSLSSSVVLSSHGSLGSCRAGAFAGQCCIVVCRYPMSRK